MRYDARVARAIAIETSGRIGSIAIVRDGQVLTMDFAGAAARLNEAQKRVVAEAPGRDWAHRPVEQISPPTFRWS